MSFTDNPYLMGEILLAIIGVIITIVSMLDTATSGHKPGLIFGIVLILISATMYFNIFNL